MAFPCPSRLRSVRLGSFGWFANRQNLIRLDAIERLQRSGWPAHLDPVHNRLGTQPEVNPWIIGSHIAGPTPNLVLPAKVTACHSNFRANGGRMALRGDQLQLDPMVAVPAFIAKQRRRTVVVGDENVNISVVVVIAESHATADRRHGEGGAAGPGDVYELAAAIL